VGHSTRTAQADGPRGSLLGLEVSDQRSDPLNSNGLSGLSGF